MTPREGHDTKRKTLRKLKYKKTKTENKKTKTYSYTTTQQERLPRLENRKSDATTKVDKNDYSFRLLEE